MNEVYEAFRRDLAHKGLSAIPELPPAERGKTLIYLRLVRGWTQDQLAQAIGVSPGTVVNYEETGYSHVTVGRFGEIVNAMGFGLHFAFTVEHSHG